MESDGVPGARVTQTEIRPMYDAIPEGRVTQVMVRVLSDYGPAAGTGITRVKITIHT